MVGSQVRSHHLHREITSSEFSPCPARSTCLYQSPVKEFPSLEQVDRTYVRFEGRKFSYFSGCDYYRLSSHPKVVAALRRGLERDGLNVAASRVTTGNHRLYLELEAALANFFGAECATVLSNGYVANLAVTQALAGNYSHALIDDGAHLSLIDAALWLQCPIVRFRHLDSEDLRAQVRRIGKSAKPILLTDGLFAHDGKIAPLEDYLRAMPRIGVLLVDDAHAAGILGATGKGTLEHLGVSRGRVIQTITLSKAVGVYGGAVLGGVALRDKILSQSHVFIGNTPLPLPLVAATLEALKLLFNGEQLRRRLMAKVNYVKRRLRENGVLAGDTPSPIISLAVNRTGELTALKKRLRAAKIFPPFIKYPGGPGSGYFRFAISCEHTQEQLDDLVGALVAHHHAHSIRTLC